MYYKFTNPGGWTTGQAHHLKLLSQDGEAYDFFGISVDINQQVIAVGASGDDVGGNGEQGSAHLFLDALQGGVPDFGP
ncbi:FG-GAP repeat protein, partial [Rhizobium leguminosarum]|uniref:FG-GAP repeat protein n=1 Tax=Rhizobium leguminosarum TaxID=384 RepID=UPI003F9D008D